MLKYHKKQSAILLLASLALMPAAHGAPAALTNDGVTKDLGKNSSEVNTHAIPLKPVSAKEKRENKAAAAAINKVPGINIEAKDLQPPAEDPEIKGFHPVKKLMAPVIRLGKGAVQLQQQVMKLEGPIGALEPSMNSLATKMHNVDNRLGTLDKSVVRTEGHVIDLDGQMTGIRSDLQEMASDVRGLHAPLQSVLQPLTNVKGPLHEMHGVLNEMNDMVRLALIGIILLTVGTVFGTPLAALFVYRHRRKIFPYMKEHEFPDFKKVRT